jgi:signal transduction histidine kinase
MAAVGLLSCRDKTFEMTHIWRGSSLRIQFATIIALLCMSCRVDAADQRRRIYFLESLSPALPAAVRTIDAFKKRLSEATNEQFDIFIDYMELVRLPGQAHIDRTVQYLSGKYADARPDVLIALGRGTLPFLAKHRDAIAPGVPLILVSVPTVDAKGSGLDNVFWVNSEYNFSKTIELAQRFQPNARNIVVVAGAGSYDSRWLEDARRDLKPYSQRYAIKYIVGHNYETALEEIKQISKDTIVVMSFFFNDGAGKSYSSPEVAADVARVSPAPVYSPISTNLGEGIVGGYMDTWEEHGIAAADVAMQILAGKPLETIQRDNYPRQEYRIDARQLGRWNISASRVPPGSDVQFREFSVWERYWWQIVAIVTTVVLQAAVIAVLFFERRRRRIAELELRERLMEVMHLNRTAVAGALSASVAHELNQPLGAIQSYAEAALLYLQADPPNIVQAQDILCNILRDDERAAKIITHLRSLLKKRNQSELQEFDFTEVVDDTLQIVRPEAQKKGIELTARNTSFPLPVRGDRIQVQQVLMNLAINGIDAMHDCEPGEAKMLISTVLVDGSAVRVSVADSGTGVPPGELSKIFDAFYTTKGHGTGLGLSIARTIVETYGGKIWAENRPGGGATFFFTMPLAKAMV